MMARKSRMETTPTLFGSNCEKTRSKAATSSSEGEVGRGSWSEGVGEGREDEDIDFTSSSLSFAIVDDGMAGRGVVWSGGQEGESERK